MGDRPGAADAAGVKVDRVRWIVVLLSGALAGLGGAALVVSDLGFWDQNVVAGRGWVAIALVIFGRWSPTRVALGTVLFGLTDKLGQTIQTAGGGIQSGVPYEFFQALPYLVTLVVVVAATALARDDAAPESLGTPYLKGA